jgi:chorismate mutase
VQTSADAVQDVIAQVRGLAGAGKLPSQSVTPFLAALNAAIRQIQRDNNTAAIEQLNEFLNQVDAAVLSGRLAASDGQLLRAAVERIEGVLH